MRGARGASGPGGTCRRGGPCCSAGVTGGAASGCASVGSVSASESVCSWAVSGAGGCCSSHCNKQVNSEKNFQDRSNVKNIVEERLLDQRNIIVMET